MEWFSEWHGWFPHNSDGVRVDKIMISQYHGPQEQKKLFKNKMLKELQHRFHSRIILKVWLLLPPMNDNLNQLETTNGSDKIHRILLSLFAKN
jgi:hypothetical protein